MRDHSCRFSESKLLHLFQLVNATRIPLHAANTGYFLILSLFPALILLLSLLRYTQLDIHSFLMFLEGLIPEALLPEAELFIVNTYRNTSGALVGISAITALWSASRGLQGLINGLNTIYGVEENRRWLHTRFLSMGYTFLFFLLLLLTLVLHIFGTELLQWLERSQLPFWQFLTGVVDLRFFLLVFLQTGVFTAMYTTLPNRKNPISHSLPGAFLASIGWLIFSHLFSLYVVRFPSYASVYGSVYVVALGMLWLYCCISIFFCGGILNAHLAKE